MIPKKASSLYKEITKEFEVSEDLVETLVENYYKTLRKKLSSLSDLRINVDGLGHFVIKIQKVKKAINVEEKLELLTEIHKKAEQELLKRKTFKDEKYSKINLAKPETDPRRDNQ